VLSGLDSLTPSERRVAELAAAGLPNRDIAQHLFITARTVDGHLTHAYQVLSITSRGQLPAALDIAGPPSTPQPATRAIASSVGPRGTDSASPLISIESAGTMTTVENAAPRPSDSRDSGSWRWRSGPRHMCT
jgi:DNA-binding CsgD family transcriptional regulator